MRVQSYIYALLLLVPTAAFATNGPGASLQPALGSTLLDRAVIDAIEYENQRQIWYAHVDDVSVAIERALGHLETDGDRLTLRHYQDRDFAPRFVTESGLNADGRAVLHTLAHASNHGIDPAEVRFSEVDDALRALTSAAGADLPSRLHEAVNSDFVRAIGAHLGAETEHADRDISGVSAGDLVELANALGDLDYLYWQSAATDRVAEHAEAASAARATLDVLLTDGLVRYAVKQRYGNLANRSTAAPQDGQRTSARTNDALSWRTARVLDLLSLRGDDLTAALDALAPSHVRYVGLVRGLAHYRTLQAAGGWNDLPAGVELEPGDQHAAVPLLRDRLRAEGIDAGVGTDDIYDADLVDAVSHFQYTRGLAINGNVERRTLAALNVPVEHRIAEIVVSLDRLRETQAGVDGTERAIRVNIPEFYGELWDDGELVHRWRVVVGGTHGGGINQTPVFSHQMQYLEFNPVWNIPPRLARTMSTSSSRGIVNRGGRLTQLPGPNNALGLVKFMFPNSHAVYLHDTNQPHLFDNARRANSSGCVRVQDPMTLAALLLSRDRGEDIDTTRAWIDAVIENGQTERVHLNTRLPIHIEYILAGVDEEGTVLFFDDIYRRDRADVRATVTRADVADAPQS